MLLSESELVHRITCYKTKLPHTLDPYYMQLVPYSLLHHEITHWGRPLHKWFFLFYYLVVSQLLFLISFWDLPLLFSPRALLIYKNVFCLQLELSFTHNSNPIVLIFPRKWRERWGLDCFLTPNLLHCCHQKWSNYWCCSLKYIRILPYGLDYMAVCMWSGEFYALHYNFMS